MKLLELLEDLRKYKDGLTEQKWKMDNYNLKNEYIKVVRIDTSNKSGGSNIKQGKQWSIIFERTTNAKLEELDTFKALVCNSGYIKITRKLKSQGQYGIRFYNMAKNPDLIILDKLFKYLFS